MTNQSNAAKVSHIYMKAAREGRPRAKAVRDELGLPTSTAGYWIRRAKDLGLIKEAPTRSAKVLRVAKALGVEYADLVRAVNRHANGDLRI